jgi:multiple antibiotic resistance protein
MWQERLSEFVTLFLVINPFELLLAFVATAGALPPAAQRKLALQAVVVAFVALTLFATAGSFLLHHMNVPILAFQIAGGIILFLIALEMVRGHALPTEMSPEGITNFAIYPLGIPKIAGPAAMLAIVLVTDDDRYDVLERGRTVLVLAAALLTVFLVLLAAGPISRWIGTTGANVLGRIIGMLLAALAVSTVLSALTQWLGLPKL